MSREQAPSKMSRADRLAAVREKLAKTDLRGGGGGFFSPKDGRSIIRILPEVGEMQFFYQQVGTHMLPGTDNRKQFYCPNFTSEGEFDCPICDYVEELRKSGDKASLALSSTLRVKRKFWMNVIDRENESAGPQIFTPGVMVFSQISSLISDPDYGDIFDTKSGIDLIIEKKGKGLDTEYQVKPRRDSTPLHEDEKMVEEWLSKAKDLTPVEVSDDPEEDKDLTKGHILFILPYERLEREFEATSDQEDVDEDEPEEEAPRRSTSTIRRSPAPATPSRPAVTRRRPEPEPDPEEDDSEPEPDEDEAQAEVTRRTARRSLRH